MGRSSDYRTLVKGSLFMFTSLRRGAWLLGASVLLAACQSPTASPGGTPAVAMSVMRQVDSILVDTVARDMRIYALVLNASTLLPQPGVVVNWHIVGASDGSVFAGSGLTNAEGIVREIWTLGSVADTQTIEARAVDAATGDPLVLARLSIKPRPDSFNYAVLDSMPIEVLVNQKVNVRERIGQGFDRYNNLVASVPTVAITADSNWVFVGDSAYSPVATHVAIRYSAGTWFSQIAAAADTGGPPAAAPLRWPGPGSRGSQAGR
jgi:hypothetical protein